MKRLSPKEIKEAESLLDAFKNLRMQINSGGNTFIGTNQINGDSAVLGMTVAIGSTPVRFSGSIQWLFNATSFSIIPVSAKLVQVTGSYYIRLTYDAIWTFIGSGTLPLTAYNDAAHLSSYVAWSALSNPAGGANRQTQNMPVTGAFIIQSGTNFVGNYTAPGSTGQIIVYPQTPTSAPP